MKSLLELMEASKDDLPEIYCDLDEVLVDFIAGANKAVGGNFAEFEKQERWKIINNTKDNTGMTLTLALSYGGKQEIFKAVKEISEKVKNETICLDNFDDSIINDHLYTKNLPDVDLLIRTSGEQRISNFLLWQIAYAELYFTDTYWPDFSEEDFTDAIIEYQKRERRFGKTSKQL